MTTIAEKIKRKIPKTKERVLRDLTAILTPGVLDWNPRRRMMELIISFHVGKTPIELSVISNALFPSMNTTGEEYRVLIQDRVYLEKEPPKKPPKKYTENTPEFKVFSLFYSQFPSGNKRSIQIEWEALKKKLGTKNLLADVQNILEKFEQQMAIRNKVKAIREAHPHMKIFFPSLKYMQGYITSSDWQRDYRNSYLEVLSDVGLKEDGFVLREELGLPEKVPGRGGDAKFLRIQLSSPVEKDFGTKGFFRADDGHYYNANGQRGQ